MKRTALHSDGASPAGDGALTGRRHIAHVDLFDITIPRAPSVSPNGTHVLYLLEAPDAKVNQTSRHLRVLRIADREVIPVNDLGPVLQAIWLADGAILAVLPHGDGARIERIASDGARRTITTLQSPPSHIEASPDGLSLAFTMSIASPEVAAVLPACLADRLPEQRARLIERTVWRIDGAGELTGQDRLFRLDLASGASFELTGDLDWIGYFFSNISWSRDSREILLAMNNDPDREARPFLSSIYAVDVNDGSWREIISSKVSRANVSPRCSGRQDRIAYRSAEDTGAFHLVPALWTAKLDGSDRKLVADLGQDIGSFRWDWAGEGLYFSFVRDGAQHLYFADRDGKSRSIASGLATDGAFEVEPYLGGGAEFCACPEGVIAVVVTQNDPGRLVLIDEAGELTDLHSPNAWLHDQLVLGHSECIEAVLSGGGRLQSWLIYPPDYEPERSYPLILDIHGGPDLAFGGHFGFRAQCYAAAGYMVLMPNYRGSAGTDMAIYSDAYRFPDAEDQDMLEALDTVLGRASIDPERLFITGLSAGGLLAAWVTGKSDRFRAAAVRGPVINWISHSLGCDLYSIFAGRSFAAAPWEDPGLYWESSPLSLAATINTPTLIVHGEEDSRTPPAEGMQLFHALKLRGVPTALLLLPGAGHVSTMPSHWLEEQHFILEWFGRHEKAAG